MAIIESTFCRQTHEEISILPPLILATFSWGQKSRAISVIVTIWVIEGFRIEGIFFSIRIRLANLTNEITL